MRTLLLTLLLLVPLTAFATESASTDTGVLGIRSDQLDPAYWVKRLRHDDRIVLTHAQIDAQNQKLFTVDTSMHDMAKLPAALDGSAVRKAITDYQDAYDGRHALYDEHGKALDMAALKQDTDASLNLDAIPAQVAPRFGLIVGRAELRSVPTALRVFDNSDDHDIDRFGETALFPGTPVAVLHESADKNWYFVIAPNYQAWVRKEFVALGAREQVLAYGNAARHVVVLGAQVRTTFTPEEPRVSDLQLEMGLRLPLLDVPPRDDINGQDPYASYVVQLPVRNDDGTLAFAPALIPRSADVADDYLPLTRANLVKQAFKFLGERYGWAHGYGTRDCSGFAGEVYRSFGVQLPRNTGAQAISPALNRLPIDKSMRHKQRLDLLKQIEPGDLIYIPGHVMLVIGHDGGNTWIINDVEGATWLDASGERQHAHLNGVAVEPLEPLLTANGGSFVDIVSNIQRIRP
ncbi:MAG: SH3 domain-containing protein [Myxococcales bacterium]